MRLIGLHGLAGCGKDEAAKALVAAGWKRDAFADRMRTAMLALDPIVGTTSVYTRLSHVVDQFGWDFAKREYPEVRRLLQKFGTEAGRDIHGKDCWVDALFADHDESPPAVGLVITDCRFNNEAEAIRARGGEVIYIVRPGLEPLPGGHASEAGLSAYLVDRVIHNAGSINDLHRAIIGAVQREEITK